VVPKASDMNSTSAFGLQTFASPIFATRTKTLEAFSPNGTKWTLSSGFVETTRPSATVFPELKQSNKMHFFSGLDLAVSKLLLTLYHQNKSIMRLRITIPINALRSKKLPEVKMIMAKLFLETG